MLSPVCGKSALQTVLKGCVEVHVLNMQSNPLKHKAGALQVLMGKQFFISRRGSFKADKYGSIVKSQNNEVYVQSSTGRYTGAPSVNQKALLPNSQYQSSILYLPQSLSAEMGPMSGQPQRENPFTISTLSGTEHYQFGSKQQPERSRPLVALKSGRMELRS